MSMMATPPELPPELPPEPATIVRYQFADGRIPFWPLKGGYANDHRPGTLLPEAREKGAAPKTSAPKTPEKVTEASWETRAELLGPPMEVSWPQRSVEEELPQELAGRSRKNQKDDGNPEGLSRVSRGRSRRVSPGESPNTTESNSPEMATGKVEGKQLEQSRHREDAGLPAPVAEGNPQDSGVVRDEDLDKEDLGKDSICRVRNADQTLDTALDTTTCASPNKEAIAPLEATESKTESTTESRTESRTEATSESRTESRNEATSESRTESTTEATSESRTESTTEATSESRTESTTEATSESEAESREAVAIPSIKPIYDYLGKSLIAKEAAGESEGETRETAAAIPSIKPIYNYLDNSLNKLISIAKPESIPERIVERETRKQQGNREREVAASPSSEANSPPVQKADVVEVSADRQEYDDVRQTVTATGDVLLRVRGAVLNAKWMQVNLLSRIAVAEGDVALNNGEQFLQGNRLEYDIARDRGGIQEGKGQIFLTSASQGLQPTLPTDVAALSGENRPLSRRLRAGEPPQKVTSTGNITVGVGAGRGASLQGNAPGGGINRLRFETDKLNFTADGWEASNVRITNDPFSPPELELRSDRATMRRLSPEQDEIIAKRARLVFDGRFSIPLLRERVILDRSERDPSLIRFGYDGGDRGGLYAESTVDFPVPAPVRFILIPQFFMQKAAQRNGANFRQLLGLKAKLRGNLTPTTSIDGSAVFTSLDFGEANDKLRGSLRLRQQVGGYGVAGEYSYRDRLFNGSLGFQTVRQNLGLVVTSPVIPVAKTGFNLSYQGSAQHIQADTDRLELLQPIRENNLTNLNRFQASAALSRGLLLWQGKPQAATRGKGLRYTPTPILPYIRMFGGLTGVTSAYSNGENQNSLAATIGLQGQFGHFSRKWLDYTGFNLGFSRIWKRGESPFVFDRVPDAKVLSAGITQQVYGPFKLGLQTAINLDTREAISTDYILEYSRRTYGITLRYNPQRELGSLSLRLSDFNWVGGSESFSGASEVRSIDGGVSR
ncbi:MAG: DUF3769 domain-containing protein [Oscillatoria sp. SIO1A7]|nr:DUF3769 domain-containing protein [Oscillatoria sp. SIO1A7]